MASLKVNFVNFDKSAALEALARRRAHSLLRRLEVRSKGALEIDFILDARAPFGSVKKSAVQVSYKYPGIKKEFYVRKSSHDLRKALATSVHAMEVKIRRASEKSERGRNTVGKSKTRSTRQFKRSI